MAPRSRSRSRSPKRRTTRSRSPRRAPSKKLIAARAAARKQIAARSLARTSSPARSRSIKEVFFGPSAPPVCKSNEIRSLYTGKCIKSGAIGPKKPQVCKPGQIFNVKTGRCRIRCKDNEVRDSKTQRCRKPSEVAIVPDFEENEISSVFDDKNVSTKCGSGYVKHPKTGMCTPMCKSSEVRDQETGDCREPREVAAVPDFEERDDLKSVFDEEEPPKPSLLQRIGILPVVPEPVVPEPEPVVPLSTKTKVKCKHGQYLQGRRCSSSVINNKRRSRITVRARSIMGHYSREEGDIYYDVSFTNPYFGKTAPPGDFIFFDLSDSLFREVNPENEYRVTEEAMLINNETLKIIDASTVWVVNGIPDAHDL